MARINSYAPGQRSIGPEIVGKRPWFSRDTAIEMKILLLGIPVIGAIQSERDDGEECQQKRFQIERHMNARISTPRLPCRDVKGKYRVQDSRNDELNERRR